MISDGSFQPKKQKTNHPNTTPKFSLWEREIQKQPKVQSEEGKKMRRNIKPYITAQGPLPTASSKVTRSDGLARAGQPCDARLAPPHPFPSALPRFLLRRGVDHRDAPEPAQGLWARARVVAAAREPPRQQQPGHTAIAPSPQRGKAKGPNPPEDHFS